MDGTDQAVIMDGSDPRIPLHNDLGTRALSCGSPPNGLSLKKVYVNDDISTPYDIKHKRLICHLLATMTTIFRPIRYIKSI